jgi:hypothetical protein
LRFSFPPAALLSIEKSSRCQSMSCWSYRSFG